MCGFSVILSLNGDAPDTGIVERMGALIAHRGPDDAGLFREQNVALVFRRLAILDLAQTSHQPMLSDDGRHVIVFNGEIYNYQELRAELKLLGHVFRSSGDTEVLLAAYREWGAACLQRLNGMWAFIVYDRTAKTLFGARDRFGVKPLFVYRDERVVVLASEIKAIRDSGLVTLAANWGTVANHVLSGHLDTAKATFYQGVEHVPAGVAFEIDASGRMRTWKYWSLLDSAAQETLPDDPVHAFRELFVDAVRLRLRSDVPVGVQLSGGLDSTSIISSMAHLLPQAERATHSLFAFCYMAPEFDETHQIAATLERTRARLVSLDCGPQQMWEDIQAHLWHQDEPVHSFTSVVGYKLMELARSHDVKVVLNGQGADEVLAGYPNYFSQYWLDLLRAGRVAAWRRAILEYAAGHGGKPLRFQASSVRQWLQSAVTAIPGYSRAAMRRRRTRIDSDSWVSDELKHRWVDGHVSYPTSLSETLRQSVEIEPLPLYLRVEDRNSMAHGVEVRLPFLDYRLVSLAFRLGAEWKMRGAFTKVLLRDATAGLVPEIVRTQVHKLGFPTPVDQWFRGELSDRLLDLLSSSVVRDSGLWNMETVMNAVRRHRANEINCGARLFDVAQVSLWLQGISTWPALAKSAGQERHIPVP